MCVCARACVSACVRLLRVRVSEGVLVLCVCARACAGSCVHVRLLVFMCRRSHAACFPESLSPPKPPLLSSTSSDPCLRTSRGLLVCSSSVCACLQRYVCVCECVSGCVCVWVCLHACDLACVYVYACVCSYVHMCVRAFLQVFREHAVGGPTHGGVSRGKQVDTQRGDEQGRDR